MFILLIAALVTLVELLMRAGLPELYAVLGIFIPLITTNCIVLARAEAFASRHPVPHAALDGVMMGLGLTLVLAVLGGLRELFGKGTLLSGLELVLGESARGWVIHLVPSRRTISFAGHAAAGAFIGLALLIAGKQWWEARPGARQRLPRCRENRHERRQTHGHLRPAGPGDPGAHHRAGISIAV